MGVVHFGNLEAELSRQGITRKELSENLGMSISTVSTKLNGKARFTLEEAIAVKKILNIDKSIEQLFATDQDTKTA